jgi:hypothetical protein
LREWRNTVSLLTSLVSSLVVALPLGSASPVSADDLTIHCKLVKVDGAIIWAVGPCEGVGPCYQPVAAVVDANAKITVDGKLAKLENLPPGLRMTLTLEKIDGKVLVVCIEGSTE